MIHAEDRNLEEQMQGQTQHEEDTRQHEDTELCKEGTCGVHNQK